MNTGGGGNTPVASGSRTPRTPTTAPMPGGEFPPIDKKAIKDVCTKVENKIMKMSSSFEENHGRMPDERTLTETIAYKLGKNAGKISFHTQAQEGVSGADLLLQMTLDDGFADDLSHKLGDLSVTPKEQKGATTRAKSKATSGTASASASSGATATGKKLIVILQAKSYHKNADKEKEDTEAYKKKTRKPSKGEPERVAGFTYQGDTTSNPNRKLQMHLLKEYSDRVKKQNPGTEVIVGYIVYSGKADQEKGHNYSKGIAWIPLKDVIEACKKFNGEDCDKSDPLLDKELSKEFMELEMKKQDQGISKCFLEDILHPHLDVSV